jgi:hypothetical protein
MGLIGTFHRRAVGRGKLATDPRWILRGELFAIFCGNRTSNNHRTQPPAPPKVWVPGWGLLMDESAPAVVGLSGPRWCWPSTYLPSFQRVAAALRARAFRWAAVIDAAAFFPPSLPRSARYFLTAAGSRFAIPSSLAGKHPFVQIS